MDSTLDTIVGFLRGIGIDVQACRIDGNTFLPAIRISGGGLQYDPLRLQHPGDLLHEAGHIATTATEARHQLNDDLQTAAAAVPSAIDEVEAIAWSWAALVHLGLPGEVLFHPAGYKGQASSLLLGFGLGVYPGAAGLARRGMCKLPAQAAAEGLEPYPRMQRWLM